MSDPTGLAATAPARIALLIRSLDGGGMQRSLLTLGEALGERGHRVDLLVGIAEGPMRDQVPASIRLVELDACSHLTARAWVLSAERGGLSAILPMLIASSPRMIQHLPALVRYLCAEKPDALLSFGTQSNLTAVWARRLAGVECRVVISERNTMSAVAQHARAWFRRVYPRLAHRVFPEADAIVAVCQSVAEDLSKVASIPRSRITTIYNPVVTPRLLTGMRGPVDHPWFAPNAPPVILGVGRLHRQKDFATLLRAFARVSESRPVRLVIIGEGPERGALEALRRELNLVEDVAFPGFVANPYAWMARASVLVLSSLLEGTANVLCEALACGCPVVSTDCPGGPREILEDGAYGPLVPIGNAAAMADAILGVLRNPPDPDFLRGRATLFSVERATESYLKVLLGASDKQVEHQAESAPAQSAENPGRGTPSVELARGTVTEKKRPPRACQ